MAGTRAMGGASLEHSEPREPHDFYATPASTTLALLAKETFAGPIWEPACGDGAISRVLEESGYKVISTDLIDRGFGEGGRDFLMERALLAPNIVMNAPFKEADDFALHAIHLGAEKVCVFMRLGWVEGGARYQRLWSRHPPARIWQFVKRQTLWKGGDPNARTTGGVIALTWYVWERDFQGSPVFGWLV